MSGQHGKSRSGEEKKETSRSGTKHVIKGLKVEGNLYDGGTGNVIVRSPLPPGQYTPPTMPKYDDGPSKDDEFVMNDVEVKQDVLRNQKGGLFYTQTNSPATEHSGQKGSSNERQESKEEDTIDLR